MSAYMLQAVSGGGAWPSDIEPQYDAVQRCWDLSVAGVVTHIGGARADFTVAVTDLVLLRAQIGDAIDAQLVAHYALGFNYDFGTASAAFEDGTTGPAGVQNIQTRDSLDRTNWLIFESVVNDMLSAGQGAANVPTPVRTASNAEVTVTATAGKTFCNALKNNGAQKLGYSWSLKNQVKQAAAVAAAQAIDITAGWPA